MPISEKQLAANRANAAKSTGPRSPAGKSRSAQNARKHGFRATNYTVVRLEDIDEVDHLRADAVEFYRPQNSQELFAIERLAIAQQTILRAARLEVGLFTSCLNEILDADCRKNYIVPESAFDNIETTRGQNRNFLTAEGFASFNRRSDGGFTLFLRYQAQAERLHRRAIEDLERLQRLRHQEMPNEPIFDPQPVEPEPVIVRQRQPNQLPFEPGAEFVKVGAELVPVPSQTFTPASDQSTPPEPDTVPQTNPPQPSPSPNRPYVFPLDTPEEPLSPILVRAHSGPEKGSR